MSNLLKFEELAMFLGSMLTFNLLPFDWWWYPILILTPDIGMLGYVVNTKIGALTYNLFHHKGIAVAIGIVGFWFSLPSISLIGVILFGHSSMDRIFGYGLKFSDNFKHTHLGNL
ncbi:MAG: DUF4260 domain-containing protein [Ekhidna sp.]